MIVLTIGGKIAPRPSLFWSRARIHRSALSRARERSGRKRNDSSDITRPSTAVPRLDDVRRFGVVAEELEDEICLHRSAHLGGPAGIDGPAPFGELFSPQVFARFPDSRFVSTPEEPERERVFRLEDRVSL